MSTPKFTSLVTFCDDVRDELGGAQTYVGVMRGTVEMPQLPAIIPKMALVIDIYVSVDSPETDIEMEVLRTVEGEEPTIIAKQTLSQTMDDFVPGGQYRLISGVLAFSPLKLDGPSSFFPRFTYDGETYEPPGLRFIRNTSEAQ